MRHLVLRVFAAALILAAGCEPDEANRTELKTGHEIDSSRLRPGLDLSYVEDSLGSASEVADAKAVRRGVISRVELPGIEREERFGLQFRGYLRIPFDDVYTFELTSDDGSQLIINNTLVIDHDGWHTSSGRVGSIGLARGHHRLRILYFRGVNDRKLALRVRRGEQPFETVPDEWFYVEDRLVVDPDLPMTDAP
jgi:hexosaminidase